MSQHPGAADYRDRTALGVLALNQNTETARIPVLVVTAKEITAEDRTKLNGFVTALMEKDDFDGDRFTAEIRRAMSTRLAA